MDTAAVAVGLGLVLLLGALVLGYLLLRRVHLMRGSGVDLCLRTLPRQRRTWGHGPATDGEGWHYGVGRYRGDELGWIRLTSFRPGASVVLDRRRLEIVARREPVDGMEKWALPPTAVVLSCRSAVTELELAMVPGTLTGFLSWLESAPPGQAPGYRRAG